MQINLSNVPFSYKGSYMTISYLTKDFRLPGSQNNFKDGLYLRTVRGDSRRMPLVGRFETLVNGKQVPYTYLASPAELVLRAEAGIIRICYADVNTILVKGEGKGIGLKISELSKGGIFSFFYNASRNGKDYYIADLFKNSNKYVLFAQEGELKCSQKWGTVIDCQSADEMEAVFSERNETFLGVIQEARIECRFCNTVYDFDDCVKRVEKEFSTYVTYMPEVPQRFEEKVREGAYINWVNGIYKDNILTRDAIIASKNWMTTVFTWEHCYSTLLLSYKRPDLAWDQFMLMFDYQDDTGRMPDCITDMTVAWNFTKPPVHGFTLLKLMEHMTLSVKQMQEAYDKLQKWTSWWYNFRDNDRDGVCEYYHGNDSGWDNATIFKDSMTIESAELSAFLALQCEALAVLSDRLGMLEQKEYWQAKEEKQIKDMLSHCFEGNKPVAKTSGHHQIVECDSLIPYEAIILGKRLPKEKRDFILDVLKKEFMTEYGIATEKPSSSLYEPDGYWRGPIWAAPLFIIAEGASKCNDDVFAREIAVRYAKLVEKSGFSENFNALTGEGNRDRSYEWAASAYMLLLHEYLYGKE